MTRRMRWLLAAPVLLVATYPSLLGQLPPAHFARLAHTYSLVAFDSWKNYDVRVRRDGRIDRVVLDDILKRHRT